MSADPDTLNQRQRRFAIEYAYTGRSSASAIKAGYDANSADVTAARLLGDERVQALIAEHTDHIQRASEITAERVLSEVRAMAMVNLADLMDDEGNLRPLRSLPRHVSAAITGLKVTIKHRPGHKQRADEPMEVERIHDIKLAKDGALDKLMKHLGLYEKDNKQRGDSLADALAKLQGGGAASPRIAPTEE